MTLWHSSSDWSYQSSPCNYHEVWHWHITVIKHTNTSHITHHVHCMECWQKKLVTTFQINISSCCSRQKPTKWVEVRHVSWQLIVCLALLCLTSATLSSLWIFQIPSAQYLIWENLAHKSGTKTYILLHKINMKSRVSKCLYFTKWIFNSATVQVSIMKCCMLFTSMPRYLITYNCLIEYMSEMRDLAGENLGSNPWS